jgi:N-acetylglucosaminyl-diphospho-decaprenol L-rhamnosyltransferase
LVIRTDEISLSIIIVNWNVRELLAACLKSLQEEFSAYPDVTAETIVVDNYSTDGSQEMLRSCYPWVMLIENSENVGFARANNQGLRLSQGRYVLMLNPDTEVRPGALKHLLEFMESHPQAGMASARLLNSDGTLQASCYRKANLWREFLDLFHLDSYLIGGSYRMNNWDLSEPREVDSLLGACMLMPRHVVESVGYFDERFFMYSEEVDLCYRVREAGWRIYWVPSAQVVHHWGGSSKQVADKTFHQLYQAKLRYYGKHGSKIAPRVYKGILVLAALGRLILTPLTILEPAPRRRQHRNLARNYLRLLRMLPKL